VRWRRNADEEFRRRERVGFSGDSVEDAKILVDRMRAGTLPRWKLYFLRALEFPPAAELVSWEDLRLPPWPVHAEDRLLHYARNLVPRELLPDVLLVAGTAQAALLERLVYRPILGRMIQQSPAPVGDEYRTQPLEVLAELRRQPGGVREFAVTPIQLQQSSEALHYWDFGGELAMHHYLNGLAALLRLSEAPSPIQALLRYSDVSTAMASCVSDAVEVQGLGVSEYDELAKESLEAIRTLEAEGRRPEPFFGQRAVGAFLYERGVRPYLTRWLLA
jgi:hypothetical protein